MKVKLENSQIYGNQIMYIKITNGSKKKSQGNYKILRDENIQIHDNLWDTAKTVIRGEIYSYKCIKKKVSDLKPNFTTKELKNEEQSKPEFNRRKKIVSIR